MFVSVIWHALVGINVVTNLSSLRTWNHWRLGSMLQEKTCKPNMDSCNQRHCANLSWTRLLIKSRSSVNLCASLTRWEEEIDQKKPRSISMEAIFSHRWLNGADRACAFSFQRSWCSKPDTKWRDLGIQSWILKVYSSVGIRASHLDDASGNICVRLCVSRPTYRLLQGHNEERTHLWGRSIFVEKPHWSGLPIEEKTLLVWWVNYPSIYGIVAPYMRTQQMALASWAWIVFLRETICLLTDVCRSAWWTE